MIEQPFGVDFLKDGSTSVEEQAEWQRLKSLYNAEGVCWFADESVSTYHDIERLRTFVDGYNVKLEKAGGIRGALLAMHTALALKLKVWSGMMVGSVLASSAPGHLLSLVSPEAGVDLDGSLLVTPESTLFQGGVCYNGSRDDDRTFGYMHFPHVAPGIGALPVRAAPLF
jgi:L-alanine-DL-glutamate epimerase-like enolase superfamily enzyme